MSDTANAVTVTVVEGMPAKYVDLAVAALAEKYPILESKSENREDRPTNFSTVKYGDYATIKNQGNIKASLRGEMAALAAGVVWMAEHAAPIAE